MTDLDTAHFLAEFKENYFEPIKKAHEKYMTFKELPKAEADKADAMAQKFYFLGNLIANIEGTLEQNAVLKSEVERLKNKVVAEQKISEYHVNNLVQQITEK